MTLKTTSVAVVRSMQLPRKPEFDALRGLFLVWMTLTHLPTRMSDLVNQPFGFISSAEGFVFLSALPCCRWRIDVEAIANRLGQRLLIIARTG